MNWLLNYLNSSVGKKQIMAITGLLLCGFLLAHLAGNMLIIISAEAFNKYAHALISNPLIYVAEAGLAALFLSHIGLGIRLKIENKQARPQSYYMKNRTGRGETFASATMPYTGLLILIFLVVHLINFKFGPVYMIAYDGLEIRDLHRTVVEYFQSPVAVGYYVFSMIALGIHLSHGFQSAFQSLGVNHKKYTPIIQKVGLLFALLMTVGFSALAIWSFFQGVK